MSMNGSHESTYAIPSRDSRQLRMAVRIWTGTSIYSRASRSTLNRELEHSTNLLDISSLLLAYKPFKDLQDAPKVPPMIKRLRMVHVEPQQLYTRPGHRSRPLTGQL